MDKQEKEVIAYFSKCNKYSDLGEDVETLRMHQPSHVKGFGNLGPVVDKNSGKLIGGVILTKIVEGVRFECNGVRATILEANISSYTLSNK